jgi:hypothetical protein
LCCTIHTGCNTTVLQLTATALISQASSPFGLPASAHSSQ